MLRFIYLIFFFSPDTVPIMRWYQKIKFKEVRRFTKKKKKKDLFGFHFILLQNGKRTRSLTGEMNNDEYFCVHFEVIHQSVAMIDSCDILKTMPGLNRLVWRSRDKTNRQNCQAECLFTSSMRAFFNVLNCFVNATILISLYPLFLWTV